MAAYEWLTEFSTWWWPRFADHLWQTTLFALVVFGACVAVRRGPARLRHNLWLICSVKFLIPAALFVFVFQQIDISSVSFFQAAQSSPPNSFVKGISDPALTLALNIEVIATSPGPISRSEIYNALTLIWLAGCGAVVLVWGIRRRKFLSALKQSRRVRNGREWQALQRAQKSLGLKSDVGLQVLPLQIEPGVWRVRRPVVVLPETIGNHLDDGELEVIMLHELVHIQRRDNLVGNFQLVLCALLWFHPLVWVLSRKLFDEREQACDEKVMEISAAPEVYASSILKVVRFCFGWRVAGVTGAAGGSNLRRRIENIMANNMKRNVGGPSRVFAGALVGMALVILVGAGVYSHPRGSSAAVTKEVAAGPLLSMASDEGIVDTPNADYAAKKTKTTTQKASPPPPLAPLAPSAPANFAPPAPPAPSSPSLPSSTAAPVAPASPASPASPPTPVAPPAPPQKEKAPAKQKSKNKVNKGKLIEAPQPVYPEAARKQNIQGEVTVAIVIGEDGKVMSAKAKSGPETLHGAAEAAAMKARFKPATVNDKPAKVSGAMSYNFVIDEKKL
ncbi:MAG: TonB family protein [Pyrinomonadaceae bacterium]